MYEKSGRKVGTLHSPGNIMYIFILGNVPSAKNSKVKTARGVFMSKTVKRYLQKIGVSNYSMRHKTVKCYVTRPNLFEKAVAPMRKRLKGYDPPHIISFHFIRGTRHKFDFVNMVQVIADLLVVHHVIEDDNMNYFIPMPRYVDGNWFGYDKENPGVWLGF